MGFLNELEDKHSQETPKKEDSATPAPSIGFLNELDSKYSGETASAPSSFLGELEQKNDTDPTSLRERKSRGEPLSTEQERVVFDADRARSAGEQVSAFGKGAVATLSEMVPQAFAGVKEIAGTGKDLLKQIGLKYLDVNPIVPEVAVDYIAGNTAEDRQANLEKAAKKEQEVVRSAASGAVQAGEEVINEAARGAFFGTPITDLVQEYPAGKIAFEAMKAGGPVALATEALGQKIYGEPLVDVQPITKDESFQRSRNRESMRQQEQQEYKDLPERTTAALVKLAESSAGSALGKSLGVPSNEQFQKDLVQELKNNAITPSENVALLGNLLSPLDPTFVLAGPLARASSKAFDLASEAGLRALTKTTIAGMNPLEATGRVIRFAGEGTQNAARKFSDFLTGSEDSFIGKLADPIVAVTRRPGMMVEGTGRVLRDIGRQIDDVGVRSRTGIIERAGQDVRSGDFMRTVFGSGTEKAQAKALKATERMAEEGAETGANVPTTVSKRRAAARTADWVFRQAEAIARYGASGAAIGTALGLPDIENAEQLGQMATTGAMVGAIGGARLGEKGAKLIDPRVSLKGKIDAILADDPVSRRADEDADIERFRNTAAPDLINKANEFGNINSVLQSFDGHLQNLAIQRDQAIARGEADVAAGMDLEIKKTADSKDAVSKMTPDAMKEYQRRVDLTLADALDQAKTTGEAVGLNNIEIKLLSPVEMLSYLRNKWGSTLTSAEYVLQSLAGNNDLSDQDQQKLNQARETVNQFNAMYQTAMGQRGFAMSDNTYSDSPMHLRPANLSTPSVVVNSELIKSQLGNNLYGTLIHEVNHALRNFKEVKGMMAPLEEYLFGRKVQNADGTITEVSKGIYDDAAIDRMGDYYAELLGGDKWKAGFSTEQQFRSYIKEEILAEAAGLSSNTANLRVDLDSPGQAFVDWAATSNKNTLIGKLRDALGLKGVLLDDAGRISDILGETISPEVLALTRQYQRQLRDYNGSLSQVTSATGPEVTISAVELLSSKILQNKYRGLDIWQKEQVLTIKDDEGNVVNEIVVPQSASLNALVGQYRLEDGMLVDENGNKMQIAPEIAAANLPNNTSLSVDQRIARNPDGSPKILSNREIQARARKRGEVLKNAIEGAMEDGSANRLRPVGENEYAGILSPTQLQAILELPNDIVAPDLKRKIAAFNETSLRKDGTRMIVEYQAAMKGGKYKALAPKIRDVVPFGFRITKDGNFLATTISVSRIFDKINAWAKPNRNRLNLWNGDTNALWEDIIHVLKNHQKGERGEVGLDVDPDMAMLKKDRINDIFNLFDKATESKNPDRSVSKTRKGQDSIDRVIMGMRMDRVNDFQISNAQKIPVDYGKIKENYMPNVPVEPVEDVGFNWPQEVNDAIGRMRSVIGDPANMPTQVKPDVPLPVNLYEAGTSLESFGLNSLKEIAEHYGFPVPEKAKRGEIIDLVENQRSDLQFRPAEKTGDETRKYGIDFEQGTTNNRDLELQYAAQAYRAGKISKEDYDQLVNERLPYADLPEVPQPMSIEDMKSAIQGDTRKAKVGIASEVFKQGDLIGSRIDIKASDKLGKYVASLHDKRGNLISGQAGKPLAHESVVHLKNVDFGSDATDALDIAAGRAKGTIATMEGEWQDTKPQDAYDLASEYFDDPEWTQLGMNPLRQSQFYVRADGTPVVGAKEVIQIGKFVLARGLKYGTPEELAKRQTTDYGVKFKPAGKLDSKEFKDWFGNSEVVDEDGNPRVMYHGTDREFVTFKDGTGFFAFDPDFADQFANRAASGFQAESEYAYNPKEAYEEPTEMYQQTPVIMPVYLRAENIFDANNADHMRTIGKAPDTFGDFQQIGNSRDRIKRAGFDGYYDYEYGTDQDKTGIFVYDPTQVKSATANVGTYSLDLTDIRFKPATRGDSPQSSLSKDERDAAVKFLERGTLSMAEVHDSLAKLANGDVQSITEKLSTSRLFELAHKATGTPILNRVDAISAIRKDINRRKDALTQSSIASPMADDIIRTPVNRQAARGMAFKPAQRFSTIEVAPDPKDKAATAAWNKFDEASRRRVTEQVGNNVLPRIAKEMKLPKPIIKHLIGGFLQETNPSMVISFPPSVPYEKQVEFAKVAGHVLKQQAVIAFDEADKSSDQTFFVGVVPSRELTYEETSSLYKQINDAMPEAGGFTGKEDKLVFGNFSDLSNEEFYAKLKPVLDAAEKSVDYGLTATEHTFRSNYIETDTAEKALTDTYYGKLQESGTGGDPIRRKQGDINALQAATTKSVRQAIAQERDRIRRYAITPDSAGVEKLMADATAEGEVAGKEFKSEPLLVRSDYVTSADGSKKYKDVVEKTLTDQPLVVLPMPNTLITKENNPLALRSKNVAGLRGNRYQKEIGDRIDAGAARVANDPEILTTPTGYAEYMRDMGVTGDVLTPPSALKMLLTTPDQTLALLKGGYHGSKTVAGTKEAAIQGLDGVADMRRILNGQGPTPLVTALHHFWGTLSKQLPPIQQEALWMRLISNPLVMEQIQNSIDGKYTLTKAQWNAIVQKAKTQNQGNFGKFGNNATANANSFHLMLANHNGKWDQVANVYKNDDSVAMRNEFWGLGHGPTGIKNKVQSFIGLTFGIPSNILDRWRFVSLHLPMLMDMKKSATAPEFFEYSGRNKTVPTDPIGVYKNYGTVENGNVPLSIALYSGLDRAVQTGIDNSPTLKAYLGAHANPGGFHWIDWNAIKNEAVGHSSLDITKSFLTQYGREATASDFLDHVKKTSIYTEGENKGKIIRLKMDGGVFSMEQQ